MTGEEAIHHLFSRDTSQELDYGPLLCTLVAYASLACWAAGSHVSSGLVVPMLMIGGLYGRVVGKVSDTIKTSRTASFTSTYVLHRSWLTSSA